MKKTNAGGIVTAIALVVMFMLTVIEISNFRSVEIIESVTVDTTKEQKIMIRYDISFHEMPCDRVNVDLIDQNGAQQPSDPLDMQAKSKVLLAVPGETYDHEGCRVIGKMMALKGSGNFHVAPGIPTNSPLSGHTHTLNPFTLEDDLRNAKLSHTIHYLSFGYPFPGAKNALDGVSLMTDQIVKHVYYVRLVPTIYVEDNVVISSHQYSVTNHTENIDISNTWTIQMPGIYWKYDFSPMLIKLEQREKYFTHLLTRLSAVIGGVWVVLGILYSSTRHIFEKFTHQ
uniref:Endoplasmic reticulum vesicle transporter C-terminal domain-containing protein n=1 Tax=Arcella intermedia TaxID=1963864 RepID=A0A6B2LBP3_9EUKA